MVMDHRIYLNGFAGSLSKTRKRVGRGIGSGKGRTCGAGDKGQCARSGVSVKNRHAEFARRLPKVGFKSNKVRLTAVKLEDLVSWVRAKRLDGSKMISLTDIASLGVNTKNGLKIIGKSEVGFAISIEATCFSKGSSESITASGGVAKVAGSN